MSRRLAGALLGVCLLGLCWLAVGCGGETAPAPREGTPEAATDDDAQTVTDAETGDEEAPESSWRQELRQAQAATRALRRDEAFAAFESIEERADAAGERVIVIEAILGQADVLREAGDAPVAVERLDGALLRAEALEPPARTRWSAKVLRQRAQARSRAGDAGAAEADLARSAELFATLGAADEVAGVEAIRAVLAAQTGRHRDAVDFGRHALDHLAASGAEPTAESLGALSAVAYGLHQLQRNDEALAAYDELIHKAWQRNDQRLVLFAYCNRAEILRLTGALTESESDLRAAIERIEAERLHLPTGPDARSEALERQVAAYDRLIRLLVDSYRSDEAFVLTERFRARSFLDLLAAARSESSFAAGPERAPPVDAAPPDLEDLGALLADDQALVSYWLLDDRLLAWVLAAGRRHFVQVPMPQDELVARVADYLEELRSPSLARTAALARTERAHLQVGLDLYRRLVASLPRAAREARELLVVSDGVLHYLPLDALPSGCEETGDETGDSNTAGASSALHAAYARCRWLGLQQSVTHLPSAAVLAELRRRRRPEPTEDQALILAPSTAGPALAAAGREVRDIETIWPRSRRLEGRAATESALAAAGSFRYLHFATHGRILDDDPLSSGIELAAGEAGSGDDGLLQAREVLGLDLHSELVTVAACRSGRGLLRRGEGLVGLTRAFLAAGAGAVVVSLWDVDDDASAELMAGFYAGLAADLSPSEALRRSREKLAGRQAERPMVFRSRRVSFAHPSFWAPYVVVGTP